MFFTVELLNYETMVSIIFVHIVFNTFNIAASVV